MVNGVQITDGNDSLRRPLMGFDEYEASFVCADLKVRADGSPMNGDMLGTLEAVRSLGKVGDFLATPHAGVKVDSHFVQVVPALRIASSFASRLNCWN